jgi:acyl dehydratase
MSDSHPTLFDTWSETSSRMFTSVIEANKAANRAALSAFGVASAAEESADTGAGEESVTEDRSVEGRLEPDSDLPEWETDLDIEGSLSVGDSVHFTKTISEADVERFAAATGDTNPIHLDDEWAEETRFNGRIVHGILASGLIGAGLARLPGAVVYLSQDLEFRAPVRLGDRITADIEVVEDLGGDRLRVLTSVSKGEKLVIDGEEVVLIDDAPDE